MKHLLHFLFLISCIFGCHQSFAQMHVKIDPLRPTYLVGEQIILRLTLANTTDRTITLDNDENRNWLHFTVTNNNAPEGVRQLAIPKFPSLSIPPGSAKAFELNIKPYFQFSREGHYKVVATVRTPGRINFSSPRAAFILAPGSTMHKYSIQHQGQQLDLCAKLLQVNNKDSIFGQVIDSNSNTVIGACYLGRYLNFMKPQFMIDSKQNLHMLCQSTPKYFTYSTMSPDGKRQSYQLYVRAGGPVGLVATEGRIQVLGAVPHTPSKASDEKIFSASDIPM